MCNSLVEALRAIHAFTLFSLPCATRPTVSQRRDTH